MTIELFWGSGSPFAWRALLALELKKLPYESRLLSFSKEEHKTPAFLAMNPRGKVPVLKDGATVVSESLAILAYLDRKYPTPPLFGTTPEATAQIWTEISQALSYLEPPATAVARFAFASKPPATDVGESVAEVKKELQRLDARLKGETWLATGELTAADIVLLPTLEILLRAAGKDTAKPLNLGVLPLEKTHPAIAAWRDRLRALPAYEKTYPPHWRG